MHVGSENDPITGAVAEPITLTSTYAQKTMNEGVGGFIYARKGNPNRQNYERAVAAMENAKYATAFSTGTAAMVAVLQMLPKDSHVISVSDVYAGMCYDSLEILQLLILWQKTGTHRFFAHATKTSGTKFSFVNSIEDNLDKYIKPETKLVGGPNIFGSGIVG